jgi:hypothetical protein
MQSYTSYKVSEFLKDRHPFIPPVNERPLMDPEQVAVAYNERAIPKLANLLIYKPLLSEKRRDSLHTLNELVSHQETKAEMIENLIVLSASNLMSDENWEVRNEAAMLVGSLLFLDVGRQQFNSRPGNYKIMQTLIFDSILRCRESVGWLIYRFSLHKDGVQMLYESNTILRIVEAINLYATQSKIEENKNYVIYLLDSMINLSMYDFGIGHMINKGLLKTFNHILENVEKDYSNTLSKGTYEQIRELVLNTLKNITLIKDGKHESIKENLLYTLANFLNSELENERLFSSGFMMSISNVLEGKKRICSYTGTNPVKFKFEILEKLCLLLKDKNPDIKHNSILALRILSDLPEGFLKIVDILHEEITLLDEVYGPKALNGLTELLPKLSKYKNPPHVEKEMIPKYGVS